jgi:hypothetical protein
VCLSKVVLRIQGLKLTCIAVRQASLRKNTIAQSNKHTTASIQMNVYKGHVESLHLDLPKQNYTKNEICSGTGLACKNPRYTQKCLNSCETTLRIWSKSATAQNKAVPQQAYRRSMDFESLWKFDRILGLGQKSSFIPLEWSFFFPDIKLAKLMSRQRSTSCTERHECVGTKLEQNIRLMSSKFADLIQLHLPF